MVAGLVLPSLRVSGFLESHFTASEMYNERQNNWCLSWPLAPSLFSSCASLLALPAGLNTAAQRG
jgi:hypothetical protein